MNRSHSLRALALAAAVTTFAACDAAEGVEVQQLPPADRPSPEARHGLTEMAGEWHFAGWAVPDPEAVALVDTIVAPGDFVFDAQRLDSIAGHYRDAAGGRLPLIGEVRRDRTIAFIVTPAEGRGAYAVGAVAGDTLWLELSSLEAAQGWPAGVRGGWLRGQRPAEPFYRLPGGIFVRETVDTLAVAADSLPPADTVPATMGPAAPIGEPPAQAAPAPRPAAPQPETPRPAPQRPAPAPRTEPTPPRPPAQQPRPVQPPPPAPRDTLRMPPREEPQPPPPEPRLRMPTTRDTIRIPPR